ncbi:MAG TPA: pantoate--beta-alanine ligase [bacterium]|nr:pantoate--beta-alanine ligase [Myxococcales bacterium]HPW44953.1 pantoate--beta-alanine ligase [bacterium]HQG13459.1 pantoate--beta-alanine ligase [bacterium]HQH79783.1 pantoate--beta-alanine ligase [bacterium]
MKIIKTVEEMKAWSASRRADGKKISFVPTMGALHQGHLSLLKKGKELADDLVLSIYVNPAQFAPTEDLSSYPRDLDGDLTKAETCGVSAVFFPSDDTMYPCEYRTYVSVENLTEKLCGISRPSHFRGVTTVVAKLFNIVSPNFAIFGEKDYQQLIVIKRMVADLNMSLEIIASPIVRESDGLAMSSRNAYLTKEERTAALSINAGLNKAKKAAMAGEKNSSKIVGIVAQEIESSELGKIDYINLVDAKNLDNIPSCDRPARLLVAAFFGKTRLIDNVSI